MSVSILFGASRNHREDHLQQKSCLFYALWFFLLFLSLFLKFLFFPTISWRERSRERKIKLLLSCGRDMKRVKILHPVTWKILISSIHPPPPYFLFHIHDVSLCFRCVIHDFKGREREEKGKVGDINQDFRTQRDNASSNRRGRTSTRLKSYKWEDKSCDEEEEEVIVCACLACKGCFGRKREDHITRIWTFLEGVKTAWDAIIMRDDGRDRHQEQ